MLRLNHFISLFVAISLFIPAMASAEAERLILKYADRSIGAGNNQSQAIHLKRELLERYPGLDLSQYRLIRTVVMAKSKKGRGSVQLRVKGNYSPPYRVHGIPGGFNKSDRFNYSKIEINNPSPNSDGPWQLLFNGKIKLRKILLVVERKHRPQYPYHHYSTNNSWDSNHRPYIDQDRYNERSGHSYERVFDSFLPLVLPALAWGTDMEGEKRCGQKSGKVADGWRYPNTICEATSSATFRKGYRPIRIFIRPDIRPMDSFQNHRRIKKLEISLNIDNHGLGNSVTIGIDLGGRNFTKYVNCNNNRRHRQATFEISGNWSTADLQNSRVWVLPGHGNSDITIKGIQIRIKKIG